MSLPAGTVTFVFTDIEGSTSLWEQNPELMRDLLAEHDTVLREAMEGHEGYVFKTIGDAFCGAFHTAQSALRASLAAQLALLAHPWPASMEIRARIALHTGSVQSRDGDYLGPPLNRIARLLASSHGGQIVLSEVTRGLCIDAIPADCSLHPLGGHRLKDLGRPESVFQLCHPGLRHSFPPLRSLENLPNNLPEQFTSFVGREAEITEIKSLLAKSRLLTLTGSGGCGKTRLALHVAAEVLDGFPDGVWIVEFATLSDGDLVAQAVAEAFGLKEASGKPILETVLDYLRDRSLMLLLDNCEHLLPQSILLANLCLHRCPKVTILATSREGLGMAGEKTYRVPSLELPDLKCEQTPETIGQFAAVRLFVERAAQVQNGFQVTDQNIAALSSICRRLDGIPLALELAATRVRSMSVEEVNVRLDQRFRLLTGGSRTSMPRQQTLRALIDWSYDMLGDAEKALLRRVSVFPGSLSLDAAGRVCGGSGIDEFDLLDQLTSLVDKSLMTTEERMGTTRYRLSETVRQYAMDRMIETGEAELWRNRHLAYFVLLGEEAERHLTGAQQPRWLEHLEREHDSLRSALVWSTDGGDLESGQRLAGALLRFWSLRGYYAEGRAWLAAQTARNPTGEYSVVVAKALNGAGLLANYQGDYQAAEQLLLQGLDMRRKLVDPKGISESLNNLGLVALELGDLEKAWALHQQSLEIRRELADTWGTAISLNNLGDVAALGGNDDAAQSLFEESLTKMRELGDGWGIAMSLTNLGNIASKRGQPLMARSLLWEGLAVSRNLNEKRGIAFALEGLSTVASTLENFERAVRLWAAAARLREEIGSPLPPSDTNRYCQSMSRCRSALGTGEGFDQEWRHGAAASMDCAIRYALEGYEGEPARIGEMISTVKSPSRKRRES